MLDPSSTFSSNLAEPVWPCLQLDGSGKEIFCQTLFCKKPLKMVSNLLETETGACISQ